MNRKHIAILVCCVASAAILFLSAVLVSAAGENTRHAAIVGFAIAGVSAMLFGVSHLNVRIRRPPDSLQ
jgi:ABC-type transport system involved in multi-copper enzyme maturation permease subunit